MKKKLIIGAVLTLLLMDFGTSAITGIKDGIVKGTTIDYESYIVKTNYIK